MVWLNVRVQRATRLASRSELHFFVATQSSTPKDLVKKRIASRDYQIVPLDGNPFVVSIRVEDQEPIKEAVLMVGLYTDIKNNDGVYGLEYQGLAYVDLFTTDKQQTITLLSPLAAERNSGAHSPSSGVSMDLICSWVNDQGRKAKMTIQAESTEASAINTNPSGFIATTHSDNSSHFNKNYPSFPTIQNNRFCDNQMKNYVFNFISAAGMLFFQDIESPRISTRFIEACARIALKIRGDFESFEAYKASNEYQKHPTVFLQTLVSLYSNGTCYCEDSALDVGAQSKASGRDSERVIYDSFDLLATTSFGDCEDKARFTLDMFQAVVAYASEQTGALADLVRHALAYEMLVGLVSYDVNGGDWAHVVNLMLKKTCLTPGEAQGEKVAMVFRADSDEQMPSIMLIDSIRPSLNIRGSFPAVFKMSEVLDRWHPTQKTTRMLSALLQPTMVMNETDGDFNTLILMRVCSNARYVQWQGQHITNAALINQPNQYGVRLADMASSTTTLLASSLEQDPYFWSAQLGLLRFRHPPVEVAPVTNPFTSTTTILKGTAPPPNLFCMPIFIQETYQQKEWPQEKLKTFVNQKSAVQYADMFTVQLEVRNVKLVVVRLFV